MSESVTEENSRLKFEIERLKSLVAAYKHIKNVWRDKCYEHLSKKVKVFESVIDLEECCLDPDNPEQCCLKKKLVELLQLIDKL